MRYSTPSWPSWRTLKLVCLGGTSFWLPDALWHGLRRSDFGGKDVLAITVLMPLSLLAMYLFVKNRQSNESRRDLGLSLMLGVWFLGGFFMAVGASFSGGGFAGPGGFKVGVISTLLGFLPPATCDMATYDGSLGALILATSAAVLIWVSTRWFSPKKPANS